MEHNKESKTLKEIAQITFDTYGMPEGDDSLHTQAAVDAVETYGYSDLSYGELIELAAHCGNILEDAEANAECYDIDDEEETPHERRMTYITYEPERAAEIWGDYEDDYADALVKIKGLEADLIGMTNYRDCLARDIVEMAYESSWIIDGDTASLGGMPREDYIDIMEEIEVDKVAIESHLEEYDIVANKGEI